MSSGKKRRLRSGPVNACEPTGGSRGRWLFLMISVAFCASGSAGLIHEVAWNRMLRLVMGNTTLATSTVLSVFMAGLGLGSYLGGRFADRRSDGLRIFAVLEVVIGVYCLALPWLIEFAVPVSRLFYDSTSFTVLSLLRLGICAVLMLLPATCMGATLPVLSRYLVQTSDHFGRAVGMLYAVNSFGAVIGAAVSGFLLIPAVGVQTTIVCASILNFLVAVAAVWLFQRVPTAGGNSTGSNSAGSGSQRSIVSESQHGPRPRLLGILLAAYAVAGMSSLVYEIAWTRVLTLMIGNSAYAFSLILTAFISGLAIGSAICSRFADRIADPLKSLGFAQIGIAVTAVAVVPVLGELPHVAVRFMAWAADSFWLLHLVKLGLALVVMLVPTCLMGASFPLASGIYMTGAVGVGRSVGTVYGANTLGSIAGSFLAGFVMIPMLGIQNTILFAAILSLVAGCGLLLAVGHSVPLWRRACPVVVSTGLVFAALFLIPSWNPAQMNSAPFVAAARGESAGMELRDAADWAVKDRKVLYYDEGLAATVMVTEDAEGALSLLTSGRQEARSHHGRTQQRFLAHLPLLFHPQPESALVIGMASGMTLGSVGLHPLKEIECVELSPEVVEATRLFGDYNRQILDDPRVQITIADGRNHMALSSRRYDVIISQPSDPEVAGVADLFTYEFFAQCRERLNSNGTICIWLKASTVRTETFRSVLKSFQQVFPAVTVWNGTWEGSDLLVVGGKDDLTIDIEDLDRRIRHESLAEDLAEIRIDSLPKLFAHLVTTKTGVRQFVADARLHTDDNALLEFSTPRSLAVRNDRSAVAEELLNHQALDLTSLLTSPAGPVSNWTLDALRMECVKFATARTDVLRARRLQHNGRYEETFAKLRGAADLNRDDGFLRHTFADLCRKTQAMIAKGQSDDAIAMYRGLLSVGSLDERDRLRFIGLLDAAGHTEEAFTRGDEAVALAPRNVDLLKATGTLAFNTGRQRIAVRYLRRAQQLEPNSVELLKRLAWVLAVSADLPDVDAQEAVQLAQKACELTQYRDQAALNTLCQAYEASGNLQLALKVARQALSPSGEGRDPQTTQSLTQRIQRYQTMLQQDVPFTN